MLELLALLIESNHRMEQELEQRDREIQQLKEQLDWEVNHRCAIERQSKEALQKSEKRFRVLVQNAADMLLVIAPDGQIVDANQRACEQLGYSYEELLTMTIAQIDAKYTPEEIKQVRQQFQMGVPFILESIYRRKDGTTVPVEANVCVFESDEEWLELALVRDISERKQAEQARGRLAEIGELAAMIVHEVRNPLTTVLMGLAFFKNLKLPESVMERLSLAIEEAERLQRLLNEILLYARPQNLQIEQLELNEFINNLLGSICSLVKTKERQIELISALPGAWVLGDRDKLKQVLINLIRNASEAIGTHEKITLRLEIEQSMNQVCVHVQNGGDPIPPEILAKLGTPFFTTKPSGNGLGLAIVKQIVEAHGGSLTISSTPEHGTTVSIALPILPNCDAVALQKA